ncbi:hypothetical protein LZ30DRAFT_207598 [Colletotrichum cereale]|nr:hypothetical protein LZ30DRAFT_207598 [Colletotrichum cereale]
MTVGPERCEDIADVETADYVFTDGCGLVAPHLAQELARRMGIVTIDSRQTDLPDRRDGLRSTMVEFDFIASLFS